MTKEKLLQTVKSSPKYKYILTKERDSLYWAELFVFAWMVIAIATCIGVGYTVGKTIYESSMQQLRQ